MPLARPSLVKVCTACAVALAFWLAASGNARAGCGDHGYVVQRANGEVVVVNEKFGIRMTDVISPSERIKKLG